MRVTYHIGDGRPLVFANHGEKKAADRLLCIGASGAKGFSKPGDLQLGQLAGQRLSFLRNVQQAFATIREPSLLNDVALIDQLLQDAGQGLLGDLQYIQQIGDAKSRISTDEMQDAVMGAAKPVALKDSIGIAGEIAIGEEQQFNAGKEVFAVVVAMDQ